MSISPSQLPGADNLAFLESLYLEYTRDPRGVAPEWQSYFQQVQNGDRQNGATRIGPNFQPPGLFAAPASAQKAIAAFPTPAHDLAVAAQQEKVTQLIRNYRMRGHLFAKVNPIGDRHVTEITWRDEKYLDPKYFGFTEGDMDRSFSSVGVGGPNVRTLREIVTRLQNTYCRYIGAQFMHIDNVAEREWLQQKMEESENRIQLTRSEQLRILTRLTDASVFEEFVDKNFTKPKGAKTFSLAGAETLIPLLDLAIEKGGEQGIEEIVLGMAHRGRLNVLANIMAKSKAQIFREFEDIDADLFEGCGDVKYHLGHSRDWITSTGKKVHLTMCFNPSHLEFVNPVAVGRARAKQDRRNDNLHRRVLTVQIHGDAAIGGEGVIQETLNLSQLRGYETGGSLHIVVNNQVGFTTSPDDARSTQYCTDICKMLQIPIFHVNGEHPEAVAQVVRLAMEFRHEFRRDVVIDMYCYRKWGHNEQDEPRFTQPKMYAVIDSRESVRESYLDHLVTLGGVTIDQAEWVMEQTREDMQRQLDTAKASGARTDLEKPGGIWTGYTGGIDVRVADVNTSVPLEKLSELLRKTTELPTDFHPHPKVADLVLKPRAEMAAGKRSLNWGAGEILAYASLAAEGTRIRLSGQDCGRGTFCHRHAVLHDTLDGHAHNQLQHLNPDQGTVDIINSPLSEVAVLAFDYGYSLDCPDGLILWEAQFGDFANVAQVIIDQFLVSAEEKWNRMSGLVMLLPHGFEGQGPEHSSARLERFLALCAEDNIQVAQPTNPGQLFHLLRRQVLRKIRKPLVVMTPKSLLRHPQAVSKLEELATGSFQRVLPDNRPELAAKTRRILACSGKIYYELLQRREELKRDDVAIVRFEQLYPLRPEHIEPALSMYAPDTPIFWVQEEPENMGAGRHLRIHYGERWLGKFPLTVVSRPASASPATGSKKSHDKEQEKVISQAFAGL